MVDQKIEQEAPDAVHSVENALSALWEKAREASFLISSLREEKKKLAQRLEELEEELMETKNDLIIKQTHLEQLRNEPTLSEESKSNGGVQMSDTEKRILEQKLKNVISKLDQYLSS
ncbi:MAG: hypothetical protein PHP42_03850 [Bacteroidota bacterium]|nr:hypothetical protein [Bacteroidota bacterium]